MKKRKLIEKIAREGCARLQGKYDVRCDSCPLVCMCMGTEGSIKAANEYLIANPKKDKPCPRCDGNGNVSELAMSPNGSSSALTVMTCPLCLGTGKRLKRADLEAEVVRLRGNK